MQLLPQETRIRLLKFGFLAAFGIFTIRLFDLQVLQYDDYFAEAKAQHEKRSILPARRGKIMVRKNRLTEELTPMATNNTLKMLFIDPFILAYPKYNSKLPLEQQEKGDPTAAAKLLAPLLINAHCEKIDGCEIETNPEQWSELEKKSIQAYTSELIKVFSEIERTHVIILDDLSTERGKEISALHLPGIRVEGSNLIANPTAIRDISFTADKLSFALNMSEDKIAKWLERRPKRYVEISNKIIPDISKRIQKLKNNPKHQLILRGIQLKDEYWRYYPEKTLGAQLIGFVTNAGQGQYGIEGKFDHLLKEKEGIIYGATNTRGQRVFSKDIGITRAQDGADIVLTIDRVIQDAVEKILAEDIAKWDADFGQIIVIQPETGNILAMANNPTFDPNEYGKVYLTYEITPEQAEADRNNETFNQRIPTIIDDSHFYRYFTKWGPEVFRNKIISDTYEPGSVLKAITMAAAINSDEVVPQTTYEDTGPVEVDEFNIRNADNIYAGKTNMIEVLNRSLNTGIAFITQKMGRELFYDYLQKFGFGQFTDIDLEGEADGRVKPFSSWAESELITYGFGQGISATPLQMSLAFSALANGGYLMMPRVVDEIHYPDGKIKKYMPTRVRRVLSNETYQSIKSMLLNSVDHGVANGARVFGYNVMGKTGTSQTYKNGKAQEGAGTTITSFAGFAPLKEPQFVILVKYDYPKVSQWGSETSALTFNRVAKFLFNYLGIPPDK